MTKERLIYELKSNIQIFASCKGIKIADDDALNRASRYVEQLSENVCISKIETISTIIEKIERSFYFYEITFSTQMRFKNKFILKDKIFMIVLKVDE